MFFRYLIIQAHYLKDNEPDLVNETNTFSCYGKSINYQFFGYRISVRTQFNQIGAGSKFSIQRCI